MAHLGLFDADTSLPAGFWGSLAPATSRVEIEIGPGDGRFLIRAAESDPSTLFVGFEARASRAQRIEERDNLRVFALDGRWLVRHLLARESVDAFHVYFPDPWWKKRHHKRRLFTEGFCTGLERGMRAGALVYLMTDVAWQFEKISESLAAAGLVERPWSGTRAARFAQPAMGSYERKYRGQGRRLYATSFTKTA